MRILKILFFLLTIIGALNWGFVGLLEIDLVAKLFGDMTLISRMIYSLVGLSALITAVTMYSAALKDD